MTIDGFVALKTDGGEYDFTAPLELLPDWIKLQLKKSFA